VNQARCRPPPNCARNPTRPPPKPPHLRALRADEGRCLGGLRDVRLPLHLQQPPRALHKLLREAKVSGDDIFAAVRVRSSLPTRLRTHLQTQRRRRERAAAASAEARGARGRLGRRRRAARLGGRGRKVRPRVHREVLLQQRAQRVVAQLAAWRVDARGRRRGPHRDRAARALAGRRVRQAERLGRRVQRGALARRQRRRERDSHIGRGCRRRGGSGGGRSGGRAAAAVARAPRLGRRLLLRRGRGGTMSVWPPPERRSRAGSAPTLAAASFFARSDGITGEKAVLFVRFYTMSVSRAPVLSSVRARAAGRGERRRRHPPRARPRARREVGRGSGRAPGRRQRRNARQARWGRALPQGLRFAGKGRARRESRSSRSPRCLPQVLVSFGLWVGAPCRPQGILATTSSRRHSGRPLGARGAARDWLPQAGWPAGPAPLAAAAARSGGRGRARAPPQRPA
jgi:hypothetical protein